MLVCKLFCTDTYYRKPSEGKSKDLSKESQTTIDSLMGKLDDIGDASSSSEPSDPKSEIKEQDKR